MSTIAVRLLRHKKNADWFYSNLDRLRADSRFANKYVAVENEKVVAADANLHQVSNAIKQLMQQDASANPLVDYVSDKPCNMLL